MLGLLFLTLPLKWIFAAHIGTPFLRPHGSSRRVPGPSNICCSLQAVRPLRVKSGCPNEGVLRRFFKPAQAAQTAWERSNVCKLQYVDMCWNVLDHLIGNADHYGHMIYIYIYIHISSPPTNKQRGTVATVWQASSLQRMHSQGWRLMNVDEI